MTPSKSTAHTARKRAARHLPMIHGVESLSAMLAVAAGDGDTRLVAAMLGAGAAIDRGRMGLFGGTPLHFAARKAQVAMVMLLLAHGATPSVRTESGLTPLHYAAEFGHARIVKLLLDAGADASLANKWGQTPLNLARLEDFRGIVRLLESAAVRPAPHAFAEAAP